LLQPPKIDVRRRRRRREPQVDATRGRRNSSTNAQFGDAGPQRLWKYGGSVLIVTIIFLFFLNDFGFLEFILKAKLV